MLKSCYDVTLKNSHLDGLAPEGLMGVGVPEVNLFVLGAGDKLLHGGVDIQTPQLICVTLQHITCLIKSA